MLEINTKLAETKKHNADLPGISALAADSLTQQIAGMEKAIWAAGWDGEWFRRAYDNNGDPVGSMDCNEGQIFIEPQGMCIMAGLGLEDGRARQALESVGKRLATPHGIVLHQPAYTRYYLHLGEISSYPPGYKENAGIFNHTQGWGVMAECMLGNGDRAYDYFRASMPAAYNDRAEIRQCEPYVQGQTTYSTYSPRPGNTRTSWLTGAAAWAYFSATRYILGLQAEIDGLRVDPCIPSAWDGFTAVRKFRNSIYRIFVHNPHHVCRGVDRMIMDGKNVKGTLIPITEGAEHIVEVWLK
jgi:cellobiose phosphorylase